MNKIDKGLEVMRTKGWDKGQRKNNNDERCILGAVSLMAESDTADYLIPIIHTIREQYPGHEVFYWSFEQAQGYISLRHIVTGFNDHEDTTWEDVEKVMEKASLYYDEHTMT